MEQKLKRVQESDRKVVFKVDEKEIGELTKYLTSNNCQVEIRMDYRTGGYELVVGLMK